MSRHLTCALILLSFASFGFQLQAKIQSPELRKLDQYLTKIESDVDIGTGALLISKLEHPELDIQAHLKALDGLAEQLEIKLTNAGTAREQLGVLSTFLFQNQKFGLPKKDDAAAFLLSDVMRNKRGNCLGLSVLCLALAERAGLKLFGVPVPSSLSGPGHLLIRYQSGNIKINYDPTEAGASHPDEHYLKLFKLKKTDLQKGYILGNAKRKEVLNLLLVNLGGEWVLGDKAQKAVDLLRRAVNLKPDYAPAHNNLGAAYLTLRNISEAEAAYKQAIHYDPKMIGARLGMAEVQLRKGNPKAAEEEAMLVLATEPENLEAKALMANVHLSRNEFRAAKAALESIVRAKPKDVRARCNLGTALRIGGNFSEAEEAFRKALELDPENAKALHGLGEVLKATGRKKESDAAFAKALNADPLHGDTHLAKARTAQQARRYPDAEAAFKAVLKKQPQHFEALAGLAEVYLAQRKFADAEMLLSATERAHPKDPNVKLLLGEVKMGTGDFRSALKYLESVLSNVSENAKVPVLQRIGVCYGKTRNHRKAFETAEQLLKINGNDTVALEIAAVSCEGFRNRSKAIQYYKRILKVDPGHVPAKKALARLGQR